MEVRRGSDEGEPGRARAGRRAPSAVAREPIVWSYAHVMPPSTTLHYTVRYGCLPSPPTPSCSARVDVVGVDGRGASRPNNLWRAQFFTDYSCTFGAPPEHCWPGLGARTGVSKRDLTGEPARGRRTVRPAGRSGDGRRSINLANFYGCRPIWPPGELLH